MRILFDAFCIFVALILQTTILAGISIYSVKPDLLLIIVVFIGFRNKPPSSGIAGFVAGALQDVFSTLPVGSNALSKSVTGFFAAHLKRKMDVENAITKLAILLISIVIDYTCLLIVFTLFLSDIPGLTFRYRFVLIQILYCMVIGPFCFYLLNRMEIKLLNKN